MFIMMFVTIIGRDHRIKITNRSLITLPIIVTNIMMNII